MEEKQSVPKKDTKRDPLLDVLARAILQASDDSMLLLGKMETIEHNVFGPVEVTPCCDKDSREPSPAEIWVSRLDSISSNLKKIEAIVDKIV